MQPTLTGRDDLASVMENFGGFSFPPDQRLRSWWGPSDYGDEDINFLEKLLIEEKDHRVRLWAARALGRAGMERSSRALCQALSDEIPSVRHGAIGALGMTGGKEACLALEKLQESKSHYVRSIASSALIETSGVPAPKEENLTILAKLLCSGDSQVKEALLSIGPPAIVLLTAKLKDDSFFVRRHAALALAAHMRRWMDQLPPGEDLFLWLKRQGISAMWMADLYSFRTTRGERRAMKVENSDFDSISKILCGQKLLQQRHSPVNSSIKFNAKDVVTIDFQELLPKNMTSKLERRGRTIVIPLEEGCLAVKLSLREGDEIPLLHEANMQSSFSDMRLSSRIPRPLGGLFRIEGLPSWIEADMGISKPRGICYTADHNYFRYLGDPLLADEEMSQGLLSCAEDLGRLARKGLIHTALIPLYHSCERTSRNDCAYRWNRKVAGRLDNWLQSCSYPNLRLSGIADLEHMELHSEISSQDLHAYVGEHLLCMSLVLGSYFRRRGKFEIKAVSRILRDCFRVYYEALTRREPDLLDEGIDWIILANRMAEEMGTEERMDEKMEAENTEAEEIDGSGYYEGKSYAPERLHLGPPNGPFPIPELIRAIHITSAFAVLEVQSQHQD